MTGAPLHQIANIRTGAGELSFDATIDGETHRLWFRTETEVDPGVEAALAACLMPAMRSGGRLEMSEPISPRVLRTQREYQAIQRAWSSEWPFGIPPLEEVEVAAPSRAPEIRQPTGRVASFFSGGVDSWSTVLENPDLTDLVFVRGVDIVESTHSEELGERVEARLAAAAAELGLRFHVVRTNLRELSDRHLPWEANYGCALAAAALFIGAAFDRILIAGDSDYEVQVKFGANWMVDQLWSSENLEIVDDGGRLSRMQRVERIASHPLVQKTLRICWRNPDDAYNCGHCRKCVTTMAALDAVGALEAVETLPSEVDLEALAAIEVSYVVSLTLWEDKLDAARAAGKTDLEAVLHSVIERGKKNIGLPSSYRRRRTPPPPHPDEPAPAAGALLAKPETARAFADAAATALLVGGYDGSGNFGDIALLDAALALLARLDPGLLVLPVVERQFASTHEAMADELANPPRHVLYFDGEGSGDDDGLVPVTPPRSLNLGVSYLYGGGFLNPSWGERKLAMLRAVEAQLEQAWTVARVSSGLQVDAGWIEGLDPADKAILRNFELLGGRDDASTAALARLGGGPLVLNTGDDAVGVLSGLPTASTAEDRPLEVNLHFAEHSWVTDAPEAVMNFDIGLLSELQRISARPLRVRPLVSYLDPRIDERAGWERFGAACAERGIEVGRARILRPASIAAEAKELSSASLTVSSSFHVALTSLLLGVPAMLLRDNPYYDQKARALLADFDLPAEFSPSSQDDPARSAELIADAVIEDGERTRARLRQAAARLEHRRGEAEAALMICLGRGAVAAIANLGDAPSGAVLRPFERRAEAAEERRAEVERQIPELERRAATAEALVAEVVGSTSWKLTAPLRRLATQIHGR
ncbi:MAG TPA: polysaccharide pyruvyl transferase family protein [Solirubrobacterales bacterium]|nr:polysaccharide pyruvyl transferase family protein [Solirubrobacterales bacterium]